MEKRRIKKSDNRLEKNKFEYSLSETDTKFTKSNIEILIDIGIKKLNNDTLNDLLKWSKDREKDKILQILLEQQNKINEIINFLQKEKL